MSVGTDPTVLELHVLVLVHWFALIYCMTVRAFFINLGLSSIHAFCGIFRTLPTAPRRSAPAAPNQPLLLQYRKKCLGSVCCCYLGERGEVEIYWKRHCASKNVCMGLNIGSWQRF